MDDFLEVISILKEKYGNIATLEFGSRTFVHRALTVNEIKKAEFLEDDSVIEDYYVTAAVVYPETFDIDAMKAGDVLSLAESIMSLSGILDIDTVKKYLNNSRQVLETDVITSMKCYIIAAIPQYSDEDLNDYTIKELIDKVVLAEQILTLKQITMGIETDGVKIQIISLDEEPEEVNQPSKEQLIKKIRDMERETTSAKRGAPVPKEKLESMEEKDLKKMLGIVDSTDPIAAKLHGQRR